MNYLKVETNNLVDLVGRKEKEKIDWEKVGTSAKTINLSPVRNQITNKVTKVTITFFPIVDEEKANTFIQECSQYGITPEIVTQEQVEQVLIDNKPDEVVQ